MSGDADDPLQSVLDEAQQFMAELQTDDGAGSPFVVDGFSIDIDDEEELSWISNIVFADKKFYLMANKRFGKLG